jgi:hypothetical protein
VVVLSILALVVGLTLVRPFDVGAEPAPGPTGQVLLVGGRSPEDRLANRAELYADLAAELGVPAEEVARAMDTVLDDRLAARVADGTITAEQAEEVRTRWDAGELGQTLRDRLRVRFGDLGGRLPLGDG